MVKNTRQNSLETGGWLIPLCIGTKEDFHDYKRKMKI